MVSRMKIRPSHQAPIKRKLPKRHSSAVWRSHCSGIHDIASPPHEGFALSEFIDDKRIYGSC